jgi:hypothetical protein
MPIISPQRQLQVQHAYVALMTTKRHQCQNTQVERNLAEPVKAQAPLGCRNGLRQMRGRNTLDVDAPSAAYMLMYMQCVVQYHTILNNLLETCHASGGVPPTFTRCASNCTCRKPGGREPPCTMGDIICHPSQTRSPSACWSKPPDVHCCRLPNSQAVTND